MPRSGHSDCISKPFLLFAESGNTPHMTVASKDSDLLFAFIFPFNCFDKVEYSEFQEGHGFLQRPFLKGNASILKVGNQLSIKLGPEVCIVGPDPFPTLDYRLQFRPVQFLASGAKQVSRSSSLHNEWCK